MNTLAEVNSHFRARGATHYHDAFYPPGTEYRRPDPRNEIFARHYFNANGEIGYVLPDFLQFSGHGIHYFEIPRKWGFYTFLKTLPVDSIQN